MRVNISVLRHATHNNILYFQYMIHNLYRSKTRVSVFISHVSSQSMAQLQYSVSMYVYLRYSFQHTTNYGFSALTAS